MKTCLKYFLLLFILNITSGCEESPPNISMLAGRWEVEGNKDIQEIVISADSLIQFIKQDQFDNESFKIIAIKNSLIFLQPIKSGFTLQPKISINGHPQDSRVIYQYSFNDNELRLKNKRLKTLYKFTRFNQAE